MMTRSRRGFVLVYSYVSMSTSEDWSVPLLLYFDASILYAEDNATPRSAAVGYVFENGSATLYTGSIPIDAFISSAHLEYRALVEATRKLAERTESPRSLHIHGDADDVIQTVDPSQPASSGDRITRRRVDRIRRYTEAIPVVTYRSIERGHNTHAHEAARAGHRSD